MTFLLLTFLVTEEMGRRRIQRSTPAHEQGPRLAAAEQQHGRHVCLGVLRLLQSRNSMLGRVVTVESDEEKGTLRVSCSCASPMRPVTCWHIRAGRSVA